MTRERVNFVVGVSGVLDSEEETDNAVEDIDQRFHERTRARVNLLASANENGVDLKMVVDEIARNFHEMRWVTVNFSAGDFETTAAAAATD